MVIFQQQRLTATFARVEVLFQIATPLSDGFLYFAIKIRRELFYIVNGPTMFLKFLKKLRFRGRTGRKRTIISKILAANLFVHILNPPSLQLI
jgi:hypothetical protein